MKIIQWLLAAMLFLSMVANLVFMAKLKKTDPPSVRTSALDSLLIAQKDSSIRELKSQLSAYKWRDSILYQDDLKLQQSSANEAIRNKKELMRIRNLNADGSVRQLSKNLSEMDHWE